MADKKVSAAASCIVRFPAPTESQRSLWAAASTFAQNNFATEKKELKLRVNLAHGKKEKSKEKVII